MKRLTILSTGAAAVLALGGTAAGQEYEYDPDTEEPVNEWQYRDTETRAEDRVDRDFDPDTERAVHPDDPDYIRAQELRQDMVEETPATGEDLYDPYQTGGGTDDRRDAMQEPRDRGTTDNGGMQAAGYDSSLHQAYAAIDSDGDGMVSRSEWAHWQSDDGRHAARFDEYDRDGDSVLSREEYRTSASDMYDTSDLPQ